jgi:hypothetical protein
MFRVYTTAVVASMIELKACGDGPVLDLKGKPVGIHLGFLSGEVELTVSPNQMSRPNPAWA